MSEKERNVKHTNDIDKSIGARINHIRLSQGLTRQQLAEAIGITHQQLQKYEKGINRITVSRLVDVAGALNVPITDFFNGFVEALGAEEVRKQRMYMEIMRNFTRIQREEQQDAVRKLIKILAEE